MASVRTLVISDLHIGQSGGVSALERPRPLELLLEALAGYQRLVLLGDTVELLETRSSDSFPRAEPILRSIGAALGPDRVVVLVPGNHDHGLIRDWSRIQGDNLEREAVVPHDASPLLAQLVSWIAPARVEVRYPGVWLGDRIWATHGHYLNHYLRPVSSIGLLHPLHRTRQAPLRDPGSYEYIALSPARPHIRDGLPPERWHDRLVPRQMAPLTVRVLGLQMRRHSLPAMAQVVQALDVQADWVIFGHVHRRGPLPNDPGTRWLGAGERQSLVNTGCWRYERVLLHRSSPPNPYWPGGAVALDDDAPPRALGLLDQLTEKDFR